MKLFAFFFLYLLSPQLFAQVKVNIEWTKQTNLPAATTIYYHGAPKLTWSDFQGQPQDRGIVAAITFSGFGYKAEMKSKDGKTDLNIKVYCYFEKTKSWVKEGKDTDYVLAHEQHHFDISYIATCIFIDKLQSSVFTTGNINATLARIYNECLDAMNRMQEEYDTQTSYGRLKDKQEAWSKRIQSMLRQYASILKA